MSADYDDRPCWESGWRGHEAAQRRRMMRIPLWARIEWLEEAQRLVEHLAEERRRRPRPVSNEPSGRGQ
jgi:hypothetical protein